MASVVEYQRLGSRGEIALNQPKKLNALNEEMVDVLAKALKTFESDEKVQFVSLEGNGEKAFCAGGDVVSVIKGVKEGKEKDFFFKKEYETDLAIHHYPKPTVALIHGVIMGGGLGLINGCDLKIMDDSILLAMPEVTIGFFPDVGASYFLNQLPWRWTLFLGLTGARIDAQDCLQLGLCDGILTKDKWNQLKENQDFEGWKDFLSENQSSRNGDGFFQKEEELMSLEEVESLEEFVSWARVQSTEGSPWVKKSLHNMFDGSPISVVATWEHLKQARGKTLEECFKRDHELSKTMFDKGEFPEGVRALLIDKDKSPQWRYSSIEEASQGVGRFFKDLLSSVH